MKLGSGKWGRMDGRPANGGSVWPTPAQVLLLKAALLQSDEAVEAWTQWRERSALDGVDPSSAQLYPLAYRNLSRIGVQDPDLSELKRHYLATWVGNQRLFRQLAATLNELNAAGLPTLVLKGAALVPLYFRDDGVRGMGDFDILVPEERFKEACAVLMRGSWEPLHYEPEYFDTRFEHAIAFLEPGGTSVDLHCHALIHSCEPGADEMFWEGSQPLEVNGARTRTLNATDHLVQVCAHGLTWVKNPPIRWVADAMTILARAGESIEWDRLVRVTVARGVTLHVAAPLDFLKTTFDAPIPAEVLDTLHRAPASRSDRTEHRNWMLNKRGKPLPLLWLHWRMFHRGVCDVGPVARVRAFPDYLRFWAQTDRLWKIPVSLSVKGMRVLGRRLGLYEYWDAS
jgi:hypothetical protein